MATFFSLYTPSRSILLLLLLSLTAAAPLDEVCGATKRPPRCRSLLEASDTRSRTAAMPELGEIAITAAMDAAGAVKIKVHGLVLAARDRKLRSLYRSCEDLYLDAIDQLAIAPEYLEKRRYHKLKAAAGAVAGGVRGCAAAVAKSGGLRAEVEDSGVLADAIDVIAKKLSA